MGDNVPATKDDIHRLYGRLDEIADKLTTLVAKSIACRAKVESHDQTLDGNGQTGLKTRVPLIEQRVDSISNKITGIQEVRGRYFWLFVGGSVGLGLTLAGNVATHLLVP